MMLNSCSGDGTNMVRNISDDEDEVIIGKMKNDEEQDKETLVLDIELTEYTSDSYAEYNWKDLVKNEDDKDRDFVIGIVEIEDTKPKQNKKIKPVDPEDDYDLDDDFIDDTEVNDEVVPDDVSTACGGFYINKGSLKFMFKEAMPMEVKERLLAGAKNQSQQSSIKNCYGFPLPESSSLPQVAGKRSNGVAC